MQKIIVLNTYNNCLLNKKINNSFFAMFSQIRQYIDFLTFVFFQISNDTKPKKAI